MRNTKEVLSKSLEMILSSLFTDKLFSRTSLLPMLKTDIMFGAGDEVTEQMGSYRAMN